MTKSRGQLAYEFDLAVRPTYHTGEGRKTWEQLPDYARRSWENDEPEHPGSLLPCPFCNNRVDILAMRLHEDARDVRYMIGCKAANCAVHPNTGTHSHPDECVAIWHRRYAQDSRPIRKNEALSATLEAMHSVRVFVQDCIESGHDRTMLGNLYSARDVIDKALADSLAEVRR